MRKTLLVFICLNLYLVYSIPGTCHSKPADPVTNTWPIWKEEPVFIREVENGKLYSIGNNSTNSTMSLIHLWGSMYGIRNIKGNQFLK